jgi:MscS family membrane protein
MNVPLVGHSDALFSHQGVLAGTAGLAVFWVLMTLLERRRNKLAALISRTAKRPLMLGLTSALYLGWILHLLEQRLNLHQLTSERVAGTILLLSFGWAINSFGHSFFRSKSFEEWLKIEDPKDEAMLISLLDRLFTIAVIIVTSAGLMITFGISTTAVATLLGGAGIGLGFSTQQISQNFLTGFMLYFNRPFKEGDWISTNDLQGTVEEIGWYHTKLRTFDRRPLYIPNSVFATTPIENPGQMYNRRIKASIGLRYQDIPLISGISHSIRTMLENHPAIDQDQIILVNFNEWDSSSVNIMVYCFTKTTIWKEWLDQQQEIFLQIAEIVQAAGADFAFPSTTLYASSPGTDQDPMTMLRSS